MSRAITFRGLDELPLTGVSLGDMRWNRTGSWRTFKPVYREKLSPCREACPAGTKIPHFLQKVKEGNFDEALKLILETNPLPGVCGRVCYHPCEAACNRGQFDQPVSVKAVERFVADNAARPSFHPSPSRKSAAIVGSGPAGLTCAYHLACRGHSVAVFESRELPGGLLRYGIPDYRLPKGILDREIEYIHNLGVKFYTRRRLGEDLSWSELEEFDAIFLALGAHRSRKLSIPGEESSGVLTGLQFLEMINLGRRPALGERAVVIGGGNTGIDVARCLLRLGVKVVNVELLPPERVPADPEELGEAKEEGFEIIYGAMPQRILTKAGKVVGVEYLQVHVEQGKISPVPGTEQFIEADTVVVAVGQSPELKGLPLSIPKEKGFIAVSNWGETGQAKVFAGGDVVGLGRVADAIGWGRRAALAIHKLFTGEEIPTGPVERVEFSHLNTAYFTPSSRHSPPRLEADKRVKGFTEVTGTLSQEEVISEAERCFSCGVCNACDNCWIFCPDASVKRWDGHYEFDYDYCKGCGVCAQECPRAVISLEAEV